MLYRNTDIDRHGGPPSVGPDGKEQYRSDFRRDYARLIHSPSFRRLQGKTQLFPGVESDFFRNRLTHSLEVAQIAKSIAIRLNDTVEYFKKTPINTDLVETAALAHDLGHPPFGHNGEHALDDCMKEHGGFEGNAQTLRILSRLEKKTLQNVSYGNDERKGLDLTFRTLAAILKYDKKIPIVREADGPLIKGYYESESVLVSEIKKAVIGDKPYKGSFKTIECCIMDVADDIAYSTYDLEDAFKAGFLTPIKLTSASRELRDKVGKKVSKALQQDFDGIKVLKVILEIFISRGMFDTSGLSGEHSDIDVSDPYSVASLVNSAYDSSHRLASMGNLRTQFTSSLVGEFIRGVQVQINENFPSLSRVYLCDQVSTKVEVLKHFTFESQIMSPRLKVVELRGYEIVKSIFNYLTSDDIAPGHLLLPDDYQNLYNCFTDVASKRRVICDFIAGMTDRYAVELYGRLKGESPQTIFKPM